MNLISKPNNIFSTVDKMYFGETYQLWYPWLGVLVVCQKISHLSLELEMYGWIMVTSIHRLLKD